MFCEARIANNAYWRYLYPVKRCDTANGWAVIVAMEAVND